MILPFQVFATFSNKTGSCFCLPTFVVLTWDSTAAQWVFTGPICSVTASLELQCGTNPAQWVFSGTNVNPKVADAGFTCDPLFIHFTGVTFTGFICTGTADVTITR